ncbi:MAG: hypothetical protein AMXMBFR34_20270 [Myxococcaceae bacterium]
MRHVLVASILVLGACGPGDAVVEEWEDELELAEGPLLGANGQDAAERSCHVVLREVTRGATNCLSTGCWWTFTGFVDVSLQAVAEGGKAQVLFKNLDATTWTKVSTTKVSGAPAGFTRYRFRLTKNTVKDGMSATAYSRAKVELAPYLLTTTGARLFDHNRLPGDFDTYALNQAGGWKVAPDASVCAPPPPVKAWIDFLTGWQTHAHGALVAGQTFTLSYALERLPDCRGTHNGYPAWDVTASVRFLPSGELVEGSVRGFDSPSGVPNNTYAVSAPLDVKIPAGTTALEVWFKNFTGAGSSCVGWDSNLGNNYRFAVEPKPFAPVQWVGNAGSSFTRACSRGNGVPDPIALTSYLHQRACTFVEVDVYTPGLTDGAATKPEALWAQAVTTLDGQERPVSWLTFVSRVGNDYRFHYELPRAELYHGPKWSTFTYRLRFSTDGLTWQDEPTRTVTRDSSFCNPAWGDCG